jgi:hypothetical protein
MAAIDFGGANISATGMPIGATNYNTTPSVGTSAGTSTATGSQGLPANYQQARSAFEQQQATNPLGQPRATVVGNDQFGQQFGYAADADAFNTFYNQNYSGSTPVPQGGAGYGPQNDSGYQAYLNSNPGNANPLPYAQWSLSGSPSVMPVPLPSPPDPNQPYMPIMGTPSTPITGNPSTPTAGGGLSSLVNSGINPMANQNLTGNPLSAITPSAATGAVAPNLGVTAGSAPGAGGLTQGTALPNITTTQQQATATPQFYLDYLNQIAKQGATAAQGAQYAGAQPLQEQAFSQVGQNVGNYQPTLQNAANLASSVGNTSLADAIGNLGQANIAYNLAPQATAGIVGSGQFGSARGAGALGQVLANADLAITQQQQQALQQDMANRLAASQQLGTLANATQNLGLGDVNALATLGGQQQTIAQNEQLFPMQQLTAEANLLKGATIPTATSSSYTGPIPGAYNTSPLAQIAGIGSTLAGTGLGQTLFGSPATGNQPATQGLLGVGANAATNWLGKTYDNLTGANNLASGSYPLSDGGTMYVNSDGTKSIMGSDGSVQNFARDGTPLPSGSVDAGGGGMSEADLYAQEQAAQQQYDQQMLDDYQSYYNSYSAPNFEE